MSLIGNHCLLELHGCGFEALNDMELIESTIRQAVVISNSVLLQYASHAFEPCGVTALALLAESHLSIHTWPESGYAAVDAFTCGKDVNPLAACEYIAAQLGAEHHQIMTIPRGEQASGDQFTDPPSFHRNIAS